MANLTEDMWQRWNNENPEPEFSFEQTIIWLEGMRQFIFEIWKNDPKAKEKWDRENKLLCERPNCR